MKETWKTVVGYPDYAVSDHGRVKRITAASGTRAGDILKPSRTNSFGHSQVCLYFNGDRKSCSVHKLVIEAFIGPRPDGMECRHLDGDPTNNCVTNLKWGTSLENYNDSVRHGTAYCGTQQHLSKLTENDVREIRSLHGIISQEKIGKKFGVTQGSVSGIVLRRTWKHVT